MLSIQRRLALSINKTPFINRTHIKLSSSFQNPSRWFATDVKLPAHTLSLAERAKALIESRKSGTLTTVTTEPKEGETPLFGSIMPYVVMKDDPECVPIVAIRKDEGHYAHLEQLPKASLVVFPLTPVNVSPAHVPIFRLNLMTQAQRLTGSDTVAAKQRFIEKHPAAKSFLDEDDDFVYYRLKPNDLFFLGGSEYGKTENVNIHDFLAAPRDPIAADGVFLLNEINSLYTNYLHLFCKEYGETDVVEGSVFVYFIDHLGFNILGKTKEDRWVDFRLPFPEPITDKDALLAAMNTSVEHLIDKHGRFSSAF